MKLDEKKFPTIAALLTAYDEPKASPEYQDNLIKAVRQFLTAVDNSSGSWPKAHEAPELDKAIRDLRLVFLSNRKKSILSGKLHCDMKEDCENSVAYIDNKGFVYCEEHGKQRKASGIPSRKLSPAELTQLENDKPLEKY